MNKKVMTTGWMIIALGAMNVLAGGNVIPAADLPAPVATAASRICPDGTIKCVELEGTKEKPVYEIEMMVGDKSCDMKFAPDGRTLEIEKEMDINQLPAPVQASLAIFSNGKINKVEQVEKGKTMLYEAEIEINQVTIELELSADGKVIDLEIEEDEEDDDDKK
ncbi:MAG: hypothetical protein FJ220_00070 [Kiritimatiellaceae bacterium]|nr:hypothetical protein [Kiritimatiellaceae bacterium]